MYPFPHVPKDKLRTSKNGTTSAEEISTAKSSDVTPPQKHGLHFWYIIN
ncbi:MAG TPA: hypothetical protein VF839_10515 [Clostridium sp.]